MDKIYRFIEKIGKPNFIMIVLVLFVIFVPMLSAVWLVRC